MKYGMYVTQKSTYVAILLKGIIKYNIMYPYVKYSQLSEE